MPAERIEGLAAVLSAVRTTEGVTQPLLATKIGLGRTVVAQRVAELEAADLVLRDGLGPSTGGRAPRRLRLRADRGLVIGIDITASELVVGLADLAGTVAATRQTSIDVADGPEAVLETAERMADDLLSGQPGRIDVWAVGVGVPAPVEFRSGLPATPPSLASWDRHPIRERLSARYDAAVWVDNDVNLLALGELRANPAAASAGNVLYVRAGVGIGAGIVVDGRLYRGANGSAGDVGHVALMGGERVACVCGTTDCLEAVAGGIALAREGRRLAETRQSPPLAAVLVETGRIRPLDVTTAARQGDPAAQDLLRRTASVLGAALAPLVSFYNPDLLVLGGGIARARTHVLGAFRESIRGRCSSLATKDLQIEVASVPEEVAGVTGAVHLALDELFSPSFLASWFDSGSPAPNRRVSCA